MNRRLVHVGDPMPMPRARTRIITPRGGGKPFATLYTPKDADDRKAEIANLWVGAPFDSDCPLMVDATFLFARPSGHYGQGRNGSVIKPQFLHARPGKGGNKNADGRRTGGDIDNLAKLCLDALHGKAFHDDGQVAEIRADKFYVDQAGVTDPQTVIEIRPAEAIGVLLQEAA